MGNKIKVAIIGSGNIGTDLMMKILHQGEHLEMAALVGIDPASEGLARASRLGVTAIDTGLEGLVSSPLFSQIKLVFDATSATAHQQNYALLQRHGIRMIDLTPAALGPYVIPTINLGEHLDSDNINMVTCGGQATIPIVNAISRVTPVYFAEIVASISSRSAGPGTRANIDEFTETTSKAIEVLGGAKRGKAIIILNPAEPPLMMRDTVFALCQPVDQQRIEESIHAMVKEVQQYVPGYRLKQAVQFDLLDEKHAVNIPGEGPLTGLKVSVFLEVEGAADFLPAYAGNLDIMTSAAKACAERLAATQLL